MFWTRMQMGTPWNSLRGTSQAARERSFRLHGARVKSQLGRRWMFYQTFKCQSQKKNPAIMGIGWQPKWLSQLNGATKNLQKYFTFQPDFYILSTLPMWTGWERSSFCKYKLYTFQILTASKMPNFHLNKMCESLIYLLAEKHHLFLQTKHNKLSGNFKRISDNFGGK